LALQCTREGGKTIVISLGKLINDSNSAAPIELRAPSPNLNSFSIHRHGIPALTQASSTSTKFSCESGEVAEVSVSKAGEVRVHWVVCAVSFPARGRQTVSEVRHMPLTLSDQQLRDVQAEAPQLRGSRKRPDLRIFVVRCGLPCDPPVGGHSCHGGIIPCFHRAVSD
jgi:hypothetical protein